MKKIKVLDVVNINKALDGVSLQGAPLEDVKKLVRFGGEAYAVVEKWNTMLKDAIAMLKGDSIPEEELNKRLNEVLGEEAMREVEITPFTLSEDAEAIILANSGIVMGEWKAIKMALRPEKEE
jgi:hypothetical protein